MYMKNKKLYLIHFFLTIIILLWANNGIFSYVNPYISIYIKMGIVLLNVFISIILDKKYIVNFFKSSWSLFVLLFIILIGNSFANYQYFSIYINGIIYLIVIISIYNFYIEKDVKYQKILLSIFLIDYIFLSINTTLALNENPIISRLLSAENHEIEIKGVGNYTFIYSIPMIIIYLINEIIKRRNYILNISILIILLIVFYKANFSIAYILLILIVFLYFLCKTKLRYKKIAIVIFTPLLLFVAYFSGPIFLNMIIENNNINYEVRVRANEMLSFYNQENIDGTDLNSRLEKYSISINTFTNNVLIGSFGEGPIGGHASWLDWLGMYGTLSIFWWFSLITMFKRSKKQIYNKNMIAYKIIYLYYFILGIINNTMFFNLYLILFFIVPLLLKKKERNGDDINENIVDS